METPNKEAQNKAEQPSPQPHNDPHWGCGGVYVLDAQGRRVPAPVPAATFASQNLGSAPAHTPTNTPTNKPTKE